ncbi:oxygen-independent coproporphyrinogen-III oxidase-like protein HemZ [Clostridium tepidiprofundi DSM 19306]|uniref:Oxygen-independent coproporphyrinogen-III oxidase-like protein HemZ n=1 Tax=Clostridium tepidiprofundi DSM 19306 TaxID=1121338 RepID=A0A151B7G6_9CLOT|nr:radical SAM protein [Clostridium tepidiprofundi]KYH35891.1 oxygen-independent coproporphyrinogen-III oxidase-like protein HemZ [Clostridium tepidiprofundi DSM 19306]
MSNRHYIIPIFVPHEGCPHNCVFCNQNTITGVSEMVNAHFVKRTVETYLKTINKKKFSNAVVEISFFGGTFTAIPIDKQNELLEEAKRFKKLGYVDYIRLSTRPDYIDEYILSNLKKYCVDIIELGVQSLDEEVLIKSGRGHTANDVVYASELIKKYGFTLGHQIMLGLPGDSFEKDIITAKNIISMKPDICRIYPTIIVKNTPMEIMYDKGIYKPYSIEEAVDICKTIYGMFLNEGIDIIRIGLQPTKEINVNAEVVAGPFHPAFRELVEGSLMNDMLFDEINQFNNCNINLRINGKDVSKLFANSKKYFNDMLKKIPSNKINIKQDMDVNRGTIVIEVGDVFKIASLREYTSKRFSF